MYQGPRNLAHFDQTRSNRQALIFSNVFYFQKEGLKLSGALQLLACADDVSWVKTYAIKKNTKALLDSSKEVGIELNAEKTEYMSMYSHQNTVQSLNIKIANKSFCDVAKFEYFGNDGNK
jgi:hypothetical protein